MKTKSLVIALLLGLSSLVFADARSEALTSKYEAACARALEPIQKTYEAELKRLLDEHLRNGNVSEINAVQKKITDLQATMVKKNDSDIQKQFAGKRMSNGSGATLQFNKDGSGTLFVQGTQVPFTWTLDGDLVKTHGAPRNGLPEKDMWFKFKDSKTVLYGNSKDALTLSLIVE